MEQLTMLDAGFLHAEDSDRHVNPAIGADLAHHATPDVDELASGIQQAITRLTAVSSSHWRSTPVGTLSLVQGGDRNVERARARHP